MTKVSIIIPLYNKEKDISKTIASVFSQTFQDYEIIVVDDGSTDASVEIINALENKKIRLFSKKNEGVSKARNFGSEKALSNYFVFLDADDYWYPNHLETINSLIEKFPTHKWFATAYKKKISNNLLSPMNSPILNKGKDWFGEVSDYFSNCYLDSLVNSSNIVFNKTFFESLNGFNIHFSHGEDTDMWIRAALKSPLVFSSRITSVQNLMGSNRSSKVDMKNRNSLFFENFIEEEKNNSTLKKYLDLNRYSLAIKHKLSNDQDTFKILSKNIDNNNLNKKQQFLLKQPKVILNLLLFLKSFIEKLGMRLSSF